VRIAVPVRLELRQALRTINQYVVDYISRARLGKAA
jgi:hypothetical protein